MGDRGIVYEIRHKQNTRLDESDKHINIRMNDCKNYHRKKWKTNEIQNQHEPTAGRTIACMHAGMYDCMYVGI